MIIRKRVITGFWDVLIGWFFQATIPAVQWEWVSHATSQLQSARSISSEFNQSDAESGDTPTASQQRPLSSPTPSTGAELSSSLLAAES